VSGRAKFVPRDRIDLDSLEERTRNRLFIGSSNGLASGNTVREAILHGLCEVIERDQGSFWYVRRNLMPGAPTGRLRLDTVSDCHCRDLIERCRAAGLEIAVWSTGQDIALPSFNCIIFDGGRQTYFPQRAEGSGCHPYRHIALSRAITEALQSRLTNIAGGRDDLYWARFRDTLCVDNEAGKAWIAALKCEDCELDFDDVVQARPLPTIDEMLRWVVATLGSQGMSEVVVVELTHSDIGIPVVHVTVPGLESIAGKPGYTPGQRMQAFLAAHRLM
jgi:YcaO-like protein with predicted kinase domain